jgi:hypothetical protein
MVPSASLHMLYDTGFLTTLTCSMPVKPVQFIQYCQTAVMNHHLVAGCSVVYTARLVRISTRLCRFDLYSNIIEIRV